MTEIERLKKQLANALARAAAAETQKKIARLAKTEACWQLKLLAGGRFCGCYALFDGEKALYVGQSINVFSRIACHRLPNSWPTKGQFSSVEIVWCDVADLDTVELKLIKTHTPPMNRAGVSTHYCGYNALRRKNLNPGTGAPMTTTMSAPD